MDIKEELKKAMEWLAEQPDAIFVGQNIVYPENQMYRNLIDIPEFPYWRSGAQGKTPVF